MSIPHLIVMMAQLKGKIGKNRPMPPACLPCLGWRYPGVYGFKRNDPDVGRF